LKAFSNEDFVKDPGYEFRMAEGEKGIQRQLSKMGGFNSGAALKALDRYNQDYASNEFTNAYNRDAANKARTFSFLSDTANKGLQATGTGVNVNQGATNANSQIQSNLGNNLASMYQQNADNQSNMFQSAVGNALYAYERNKPVTGTSTVPSGGYSTPPFNGSSPQKPWYLS
jgi:CRISPR/Cas system-associated protein Cas7 (RAMP superfamily)